MLTSAELAELQDVAQEAMPDICTIQRATEMNTKGSVALTYANLATGVACRIMPARGTNRREYVIGEKVTITTEYILTLPWGQDIQTGDKVICEGITYKVLGVQKSGSYRTAVRADLAW